MRTVLYLSSVQPFNSWNGKWGLQIWALHGGFLKWWYPTTICFPTKMIILGCFGGTTMLRKHPHDQFKILKFFVSFSSSLQWDTLVGTRLSLKVRQSVGFFGKGYDNSIWYCFFLSLQGHFPVESTSLKYIWNWRRCFYQPNSTCVGWAFPTSLSSIKSNELHSGSAKANDEELQACINVSLAEKWLCVWQVDHVYLYL